MNYISKIFTFSLVPENIIFVIFEALFIFHVVESQQLVKVNALTLTFDISLSNQLLNS